MAKTAVRRDRTGAGTAGFVLAGLGLSAVALAIAPLLMPPSYSWVANTTSESAAQGTEGAWLARLGFLLFGLSVVGLAVTARAWWGPWAAGLHFAFGALLTATAAFATRPWTGAPFDATEDALHSATATAMGFAFAFGVVAAAIRRGRLGGAGGHGVRLGRLGGGGGHGVRHVAARVADVTAVAASFALPLAMSALPAVDGVLQRLMFVIAYVWYGLAAARFDRPR